MTPSALKLVKIKRTDPRLLKDMAGHYSQPKGFVGRNRRDAFFSITKENKQESLKQIVNNIFYHVEKKDGRYPIRNMVPTVLSMFRTQITEDWQSKYGDQVIGFESLIELPRTGEAYKRDGWIEVGITKGQTCKRVSGKGTDSWTGKRVWDTKNLRPKRVFVRNASIAVVQGKKSNIGTQEQPKDRWEVAA